MFPLRAESKVVRLRNYRQGSLEIEKHTIKARNMPFGAAIGTVLLLIFVLIYYIGTRRRDRSE